MGIFSFLKDASESAKRELSEDERNELENMEASMKRMSIDELGEFFTKKIRSSSSTASSAKVVKITVECLQNYSTTERENFISDYRSRYSKSININFLNLVKKSLN